MRPNEVQNVVPTAGGRCVPEAPDSGPSAAPGWADPGEQMFGVFGCSSAPPMEYATTRYRSDVDEAAIKARSVGSQSWTQRLSLMPTGYAFPRRRERCIRMEMTATERKVRSCHGRPLSVTVKRTAAGVKTGLQSKAYYAFVENVRSGARLSITSVRLPTRAYHPVGLCRGKRPSPALSTVSASR